MDVIPPQPGIQQVAGLRIAFQAATQRLLSFVAAGQRPEQPSAD